MPANQGRSIAGSQCGKVREYTARAPAHSQKNYEGEIRNELNQHVLNKE